MSDKQCILLLVSARHKYCLGHAYTSKMMQCLVLFVWHANLTVHPGFLCAKPVCPISGRLPGVNSISSKFSEKKVSGAWRATAATLTCPLTPAEMSVHVLRRRNCGLTRGQNCGSLPVITVAKIGAGQCRGPYRLGHTEMSHKPYASHSRPHSRTQSGRGSGRESPGSRTSPAAMAKGEGAAQPRLLKLILRSNAATCTQTPEFSEMRKCHPPMCPGSGGVEKSRERKRFSLNSQKTTPSARSNFQWYQQPASNLTQPQAYLYHPQGPRLGSPWAHPPPITASARHQDFWRTSPRGSGLSQNLQVLSSLIVTPKSPKANVVPVSPATVL